MDERQAPASWLLADETSDATARLLETAGCRPDRGAVGMRGNLARIGLDARATPADARIVRVEAERELDAWLDVAGSCGWFDTDRERAAWKSLHLGLGFGAAQPSRLHVAFRGDRPVGMASAFWSEGIALLNAVGVLDPERRRGIGRSLALARLREARDGGCELAVLAPSPDGATLYEALGFETHPEPADRWFYLPAVSEWQ